MQRDEMAQLESKQDFSDTNFWRKLRRHARAAGRQVVEKALWLYYTAREPATPKWARRTIYAALAYFILPLDAIPDMIPGAGFGDDLGALAAALATVAFYITPNAKRRAAEQVGKWFDEATNES